MADVPEKTLCICFNSAIVGVDVRAGSTYNCFISRHEIK